MTTHIKLIMYESSKISLTDSGLMIFVVLQATIDVSEPRPECRSKSHKGV